MALVTRTLQRSRLSSPASWRLFASKAGEQGAISPDVYASEEHRWDQHDPSNPRDSRFPAHVSVVEGGPQVSTPDFPRIVRHSLMDPGFGFSYSHCMRDPPYQYQPAIHHRSMATRAGPELPRPANLHPPPAAFDAGLYHPEDRTSALQQDARDARFPPNISVVEGGPRVATADWSSVMRHSLMEPGYSLRDPSYSQ